MNLDELLYRLVYKNMGFHISIREIIYKKKKQKLSYSYCAVFHLYYNFFLYLSPFLILDYGFKITILQQKKKKINGFLH